MGKFLSDAEKEAIVREICGADSMMTVKDAAIKYECSLSTLRKYIASLKESNPSLYTSYREHAVKMENFGKKKGGQNGKRLPTKSIQEIIGLALEFLRNEHSLRSFEDRTGIPKSTIHELFSSDDLPSEIRDEIVSLYYANQTVNKNTTGRKK